MRKLSLILICFSFLATGCTSGYRVYINGYSELTQPIKQNASFYVEADDTNSPNPIFDNQIKAKIESLLERHSYTSVSDINDSEYVISFRVGSDSHQYYSYEPYYHTYFGYHHGYWSGYNFGYTTYVPYYDTYYDRWLSMKVTVRSDDSGTGDKKALWVGEAAVSTGSDDIRGVIDYLLVGCFRYFGADTSRQRNIVIAEDDPEILHLESIR